ncbi:transcriptional regulator PpsR [Roseiarcus fermentans]|uniref:Transcriptional regulator PpsR n=1 Tax=Roseiarcus fermentans TaxID=1473586 RepID=A0A366FBI5_9HYPH|nr:transcriptional regulator PpsR [Roseiarcus fermentans]RBP11320.1 transcriptional regulator PpsR [Roseiarcus fermentans]
MSEPAQFPPDITLAVDGEGVIRTAVSAEALADEQLDQWRGMLWTDTVPPEAAAQVARAVESARREGESSCFTLNQRLPSGRELLLEYTTVKLGDRAGFVAIGKNVQDVSDLKARLASVQRDREHDYWKLREIETRYRALLDASSEAVALVRVDTLRVVEANAAASKSLGLFPGAVFLPDLADGDRKALHGLLATARMNGRAPSIVLHLLDSGKLSLRASMLTSEAGTFYLFQMAPLDEEGVASHAADTRSASFSLETFVWRLPEGFAILDRDGVVRFANLTFLDMVQAGVESAVIGKNAGNWFNRPGTGLRMILNLVAQHGVVRSLRTTLESDLGLRSEVEISAVGDRIDRPRFFGLIVRDAMSRPKGREGEFVSLAPGPAGFATSLETAVRSSVEAVERQRLVDALAQCAGNRTAAARSLGISRQSLYTKLKKYGLDQH